jgi:hypothetical protein
MGRVLVTGMSGAGKSTLLIELARRGHRTIDTDYGGWTLPNGLWDPVRIQLVHYYDHFDHNAGRPDWGPDQVEAAGAVRQAFALSPAPDFTPAPTETPQLSEMTVRRDRRQCAQIPAIDWLSTDCEAVLEGILEFTSHRLFTFFRRIENAY